MMVAVVAGLVVAAGMGIVALRRSRMVITVEGDSMRPTYRHGDRLLLRTGGTCHPGDVVVFTNPRGSDPGPSMLVKRVAATAGDEVPQPVRTRIGDERVPAGRIVVLGDAAQSLDSRYFGYVAADTVVGVVIRELARKA
jgi:signal peptidase I